MTSWGQLEKSDKNVCPGWIVRTELALIQFGFGLIFTFQPKNIFATLLKLLMILNACVYVLLFSSWLIPLIFVTVTRESLKTILIPLQSRA